MPNLTIPQILERIGLLQDIQKRTSMATLEWETASTMLGELFTLMREATEGKNYA